jgi:hypothetical protein
VNPPWWKLGVIFPPQLEPEQLRPVVMAARSTEEVDIVGMKSGRVTLVGEVTWRNKSMDANLIKDFQNYKVPAMRQAELDCCRHPRGRPRPRRTRAGATALLG